MKTRYLVTASVYTDKPNDIRLAVRAEDAVEAREIGERTIKNAYRPCRIDHLQVSTYE